MSKKKPISGTKEWAVHSVNCIRGCIHNCRYCFARHNAVNRFHQISSTEEWCNPQMLQKEVDKNRGLRKGRIMFPTNHDIVPEMLEPCLIVLKKLLAAGNEVLVVSKPHFNCIEAICEQCGEYRKQLLFRFTIGAKESDILRYWEPGAPLFAERIKCLQYAFHHGFQTSVSAEPMLDAGKIVELFYIFEPFVTDGIWIGKMNQVRKRVEINSEEDERWVRFIEMTQTDERIRDIYDTLKQEPKVRWKESIKSIVGLPIAPVAGWDR